MAKQAKRWSKKLTDLVNKRKKAKGKEKADIQKQINEEYKRLGMNSKGEVVRSNDAKAGRTAKKEKKKNTTTKSKKVTEITFDKPLVIEGHVPAEKWSKKLTELVKERDKSGVGRIRRAELQKEINKEYARLNLTAKGKTKKSDTQIAERSRNSDKTAVKEREEKIKKLASQQGILGVINSNKDLQRDLDKMIHSPNRSIQDVLKQIKPKVKAKTKKKGKKK